MYSNSFDAVKKIYKTEGLRAFYRGMSASYLGITESVLQFVIYDKLKQIMQHQSGSGTHDFIFCTPPTKRPLLTVIWPHAGADALPPSVYLGTASVAKLIAAAATYPHEVIRTRLREAGNIKYRGLFSGLVLIAKEEGVRGLYGGMGAHLMRVVPNAAIMFLTYEMVVEALSTSRPHSR
jgi:solute carrier family 25, member 33/36